MNVPHVSLRAEFAATLKLAAPIVLTQVGHMSMGLVDTMVAGKINTTALAGLGLAANVFWTFSGVAMGALMAYDTFFSQSIGAKDSRSLARYLGQSFWSAAVVTTLSAFCIVFSWFIYTRVADPGATREAVSDYLQVIVWALPSLYLFFVLQRYWQARHRVVEFAVMIIGANLLNLLLDLALGLGLWGFPRMEVKGLALASVICKYAMLAWALWFTHRHLRSEPKASGKFDLHEQLRIFRLGFPAAGHTALEVGAFSIATFIVGSLGAVPLAAHHVCLMMAAFTFMFPLGFSAAAAVRVGTFIGASEPERARLAGWLCVSLSTCVMSAFAVGYLLFPEWLLKAFTQDPKVLEVGARILVLVAIFQIADGIQVSTTGALRGLGNTSSAMFANLIGHYPVGLALGLFLCFPVGLGVIGMWTGLAVGLIAVAIILLRTWVVVGRSIHRIRPISPTSPTLDERAS